MQVFINIESLKLEFIWAIVLQFYIVCILVCITSGNQTKKICLKNLLNFFVLPNDMYGVKK